MKGKIIWNFYEAEILKLGKFGGQIFAPQAIADINEPNGSVIVKNLTHVDEAHNDPYRGIDPNPNPSFPIPEPGPTLLLILSGLVLGVRRKRS